MYAQNALRIDIVSDVVCPWCVIGFYRLKQAISDLSLENVEIHWQPFELNPGMPAEGQNLREHLVEKYGSTPQDSQQVRDHLTTLGKSLGFAFNFNDDMRIYNTRNCHRLLAWAGLHGKQTALKEALFRAYFTESLGLCDEQVLLNAISQAGLDVQEGQRVLASDQYTQEVESDQMQWHKQGIHAVPAVIVDSRYLINGAQEVDVYRECLASVVEG
ncbi:Uncharacterised protein [BD1-7 clade bacterium]|uniref:DSBA-like thioredoxin domain-containing protein n=1 Tax=BD1-7 clade bacterium TaxID=2029982 RepID=A0A5S9Q6V6_9GAMM|nr:Uncharacterised protein [BD1-7 clade bacterium]CAA0113006.1 Uncharacterised protein [BD1-7 clade bacterium]